MTDNRPSLVLTIASLACIGAAAWALWHFDVFSGGVEVTDEPIVAPSWLVRGLVSAVGGMTAYGVLSWLGIGAACSRFGSWFKSVEAMPEKVDAIYTHTVPSVTKEKS